MSVALLLSHLGEAAAAARIDGAVADHLATRGTAALRTNEVGERIRAPLISVPLGWPGHRSTTFAV